MLTEAVWAEHQTRNHGLMSADPSSYCKSVSHIPWMVMCFGFTAAIWGLVLISPSVCC